MRHRKQVIALFLSAVMLLGNTPAALAADDAATPEFPDYTAQLYRDPNNTDDPLKDNDTISTGDTLYYTLTKSAMVSDDGNDSNDVQEDTTYRISLPEPLICAATANQSIVVQGPTSEVTVGSFSMTEGSADIAIRFDIPEKGENNPDGVTLEWLTDFHLSFGCTLDQNKLEDCADDQGQLTITLPGGDSLDLMVSELVPPEPVLPNITKTNNGITQQGETTWTITYTPGNETYTGTVPTQLVDTLPEGLELVENSVEISPTDAAQVDSENPLTFHITGNQAVNITYDTVFTSDTWIDIFKAGTWKGTFSNSVQAYHMVDADPEPWGNAVTSSATQTINSKLLSKNSSDIDYDPDTKTYSATWTITVRPQGQVFDSLVLTDTMGSGLIIPDHLDDLKMAIHYLNSDSGAPIIEIKSDDITRSGQTLTIDLSAYLEQIDGRDFALKYTTKVNGEDLQAPPVDLNAYKNEIQADIALGDDTFTTSPISYTPENVEQVLLTHRGVSANTQEKTITWETTINPDRSGSGWDLPSPNLTEIVYRDALPKSSSSTNSSVWHSFGWTDEMRQATVDTVRESIAANLEKQNLSSDLLKSVEIIEEPDQWVLEVKLSGTGTHPITFQYKTYARDPKFWAGNKKGVTYYYKNTVGLAAGGTKIDDTALTDDVLADGNVAVTPKEAVLRKWPMNTYDPSTRTLTWELFLNERAANLGSVKIEELLPDGMTYVEGSARIGYDRNNGTITTPLAAEQVVSGTDGSLNFFLKDVTKFCRIQFDVTVDVERLTRETTAFSNTAKLFVIDEADPEQPWVQTASASETARLVNKLLTKTSGGVTGSGSNRSVTYTVQLNPLGMNLANLVEDAQNGVWLTDTLDPGLVLDLDSVKLYEGVVKTTGKPNSSTHTYTPKVEQGAAIDSPEMVFDAWTNQLRIRIPDATKAYYLTYTAYVVTANVALDNQITLDGSTLGSSGNAFGSANVAVTAHVSVGIKLRPPADKYFSVTVEKLDSDTRAALAGAEFGLYTVENDESSLVVRGVTAADGTCVLSVPISDLKGADTVYVKEIAAPDGYLMDRSWHAVDVQTGGDGPAITVENTQMTENTEGRVDVTVTINSEEPVDPWAITEFPFLVYEAPPEGEDPGDPMGPFYPDRDGKLIVDGLDPDKEYIIVPDRMPEGYETPQSITVTPGSGDPSITIQPEVTPPDPGDGDGDGGGTGGGDGDGGGDTGDGDGDGGNTGGGDGGGDTGDGDGNGGNTGDGDGGSTGGGTGGGTVIDPGGQNPPTDPGEGQTPTDPDEGETSTGPGSGDPEEEIVPPETPGGAAEPEDAAPGGAVSGTGQSSIPYTGVVSRKELWLAGGLVSLATALWLLLPRKKRPKAQ